MPMGYLVYVRIDFEDRKASLCPVNFIDRERYFSSLWFAVRYFVFLQQLLAQDAETLSPTVVMLPIM